MSFSTQHMSDKFRTTALNRNIVVSIQYILRCLLLVEPVRNCIERKASERVSNKSSFSKNDEIEIVHKLLLMMSSGALLYENIFSLSEIKIRLSRRLRAPKFLGSLDSKWKTASSSSRDGVHFSRLNLRDYVLLGSLWIFNSRSRRESSTAERNSIFITRF